jgi:hypothetical protein
MIRTPYRRRVAATLVAAAAAAILAVLAATAWAPLAEAHDHRIPETALRKGARDLQGGLLVAESFWSRSTGEDRCEGDYTDYVFRYPESTGWRPAASCESGSSSPNPRLLHGKHAPEDGRRRLPRR